MEKIMCTRCEKPKPPDMFTGKSTRCDPCRLEANALNIANWRQSKDELEKSRLFNKMMVAWLTPNHVRGHGTG